MSTDLARELRHRTGREAVRVSTKVRRVDSADQQKASAGTSLRCVESFFVMSQFGPFRGCPQAGREDRASSQGAVPLKPLRC